MNNPVLTSQDQEEALSRVYVSAVAARAGFVTLTPEMDRYRIDMRIQSGGSMRPALELQLKATTNLGDPNGDGFIHFPLKVENYNTLRKDTQTPSMLVVLDLPKDKSEWMTITTDCLVLRRRAYWLNLRGREETLNRSTITVQIPRNNLFHVDSLRRLMQQSRNGQIQ